MWFGSDIIVSYCSCNS